MIDRVRIATTARQTLIAASLLTLAAPARAEAPSSPAWPDTTFSRVAALALIEQLRTDLLTQPSATLTLEHWCGVHHLAAQPVVHATLQPGRAAPLLPADRARLQIGASEPVRYRHVLLTCGNLVLSDAENWYVPARLTAEMNHRLDTSDTPFGKVVAPLAFRRTTVSSTLLWSPLPQDWPTTQSAPATRGQSLIPALTIPEHLFQNRAVLTRGEDGRPFALVVESYRRDTLAFDLPPGAVTGPP